MDKGLIVKKIAVEALNSLWHDASNTIKTHYPFVFKPNPKRQCSLSQRMKIYIRDGFIDRYDGHRLVNPGVLKVISYYFPAEFPYHPHGRMNECHLAYWELIPTIDHVQPLICGGVDDDTNWVTTSMLNNSIKSVWTLEQLRWELLTPGEISEWDGLSGILLDLVAKDANLLNDAYIKRWHSITKSFLAAL